MLETLIRGVADRSRDAGVAHDVRHDGGSGDQEQDGSAALHGVSQQVVEALQYRVSDAGEGKNLYEKLSMVVSKFLNINIEFLGVIPQDSYITKAIMKQKPVSIMYPNAAASKQFEAIAKKLSGTQQDVSDSRRGIRGYFKNFFAKKNV